MKYKETKKVWKPCIVCGKEMFGTKGKKFCSGACSSIFNRKKNFEKIGGKKKQCKECGKEFIDSMGYKRYCSDNCRNEKYKKVESIKICYCLECGELFKKVANQKFCSPKCKYEFNYKKSLLDNKKEKKVCPTCKIEFYPNSNNQLFCSPKCTNKERKKNEQRKRDKKNKKKESCECCGFNFVNALHYHHLDREKCLGGITLCANCHYIFHGVYGCKVEDYSRNTKQEVIDDINKIMRT